MKITQDVRDYADGLSANEKADLERMSEAEVERQMGEGPHLLTEAERQKGMAEMSEKYAEVGNKLYVEKG